MNHSPHHKTGVKRVNNQVGDEQSDIEEGSRTTAPPQSEISDAQMADCRRRAGTITYHRGFNLGERAAQAAVARAFDHSHPRTVSVRSRNRRPPPFGVALLR